MTRITATLAMLIFFVTNVYSDYPYGEGTFDYSTSNVQSFEGDAEQFSPTSLPDRQRASSEVGQSACSPAMQHYTLGAL